MRILGATFDSKLTFKTHFRKVVLKAATNIGVVRQAGRLFDCLHVLESSFNAYVLSNLEYCAPKNTHTFFLPFEAPHHQE